MTVEREVDTAVAPRLVAAPEELGSAWSGRRSPG